ncbi:MAG TPA: hypothetical protein VEZ90_00200, partial [Blastocatellia bacterium]|nr:hypothetical protein [Blastocatellia bacterium]
MPNAPEKPKLRKVTRVVRSPERTIPGLPDDSLTGYSLTPLQLLGVILKVALKDRITDEVSSLDADCGPKEVRGTWVCTVALRGRGRRASISRYNKVTLQNSISAPGICEPRWIQKSVGCLPRVSATPVLTPTIVKAL